VNKGTLIIKQKIQHKS